MANHKGGENKREKENERKRNFRNFSFLSFFDFVTKDWIVAKILIFVEGI